MTDWSTWLEEERKRIQALILGDEPTFQPETIAAWVGRHRSIRMTTDHINPDNLAMAFFGTLKPPPTRAETIKAVWEEAEPHWAERATKYGLVVVCPHLGEFDFEQYRVGDMLVWECEGVVVKREPIVTIEIR